MDSSYDVYTGACNSDTIKKYVRQVCSENINLNIIGTSLLVELIAAHIFLVHGSWR